LTPAVILHRHVQKRDDRRPHMIRTLETLD
jgi:hypothetical protein